MSAISALRRIAGAESPPAARCELCAEPLAAAHEHVIELPARTLACACTGCALLFDASGTRRRLPRDVRILADDDLSPAEWAALGIPIQLAFLTLGDDGSLRAAYPSPAGMVTAALEPELWPMLVAAHPRLASMAPETESLLVNRMSDPHQLFLVPLDRAFELAGLIRQTWSGFSGGERGRHALRTFCAELLHA